MEVSYKKDINHTYVVFQDEKINTESFQVQMVLHNLVEGLLPCSILQIDERHIWRCECTGMQSLEVYCRTQELKKEEFIWIVNQLLENIQEMQDFLLDVDSMYLTPGEIYIHPERKRILCCMVPFYSNGIWSSLKQILQFLLQYLDAEDHEGAAIAYGFFRTLSKEDCSMELLWSLLYEKQRKWKINSQDTLEKDRQEQEIQDIGERDNLLDELFSHKEEEERENSWNGKVSKDFLKKILYLFPSVAAIFLFLYLVFNFWTMSGVRLAVYAGLIVVLQGLGLLFYWKWGREIREINPLLDLEAQNSSKEVSREVQRQVHSERLDNLEEGTALLAANSVPKIYLVRADTRQRYELKEQEMVIGKNKERAQILLTEPTVSRIHAMITKKGNTCYIQDLNSKNGTYINGERLPIRQDTLLQTSDELYIANIRLYLQL